MTEYARFYHPHFADEQIEVQMGANEVADL